MLTNRFPGLWAPAEPVSPAAPSPGEVERVARLIHAAYLRHIGRLGGCPGYECQSDRQQAAYRAVAAAVVADRAGDRS